MVCWKTCNIECLRTLENVASASHRCIPGASRKGCRASGSPAFLGNTCQCFAIGHPRRSDFQLDLVCPRKDDDHHVTMLFVDNLCDQPSAFSDFEYPTCMPSDIICTNRSSTRSVSAANRGLIVNSMSHAGGLLTTEEPSDQVTAVRLG